MSTITSMYENSHYTIPYPHAQNAFSTASRGPSGVMNASYGTFAFLKGSPGYPGNTKDPVSDGIARSWSKSFKDKMDQYWVLFDRNERQIAINEFNRTGTSIPKAIGSEFVSDYHQLQATYKAHNIIQYSIIIAIVAIIWLA